MKNDYFLRKAEEQGKWRLKDSINLLPSENMASADTRALLSSDFSNRYTLPVNAKFSGDFIENSYRGTRITTEIEKSAEKAACEVFGSKHACVQPLSGHIAAMIVIASTSSRGDTICSIPTENGGYDGYAQGYIPDLFGLTAIHTPFDARIHNIKVPQTADLIRKKRPNVVILGASFILFPYDIAPIAEACGEAGSTLVYDGSHVLGLIAGGGFQKPLKEGAEILYGSTHKSFFGPQGGLIVTDSENLDSRMRRNLTWRIVDNIHWNRVAALGNALLEMRRFGKSYAKQVVKNAKGLGKELVEKGFPIKFASIGFTESHQLLIDQKKLKNKFGMTFNEFSITLERSNIIVDSVGRLGTGEITRLGMKEKDLPELADLFIEALGKKNIQGKVKRLRSRFKIDYAF